MMLSMLRVTSDVARPVVVALARQQIVVYCACLFMLITFAMAESTTQQNTFHCNAAVGDGDTGRDRR